MTRQRIVGIMGVSGVGKSTILSSILTLDPTIHIIPTLTDRPARDDEIDREHTFASSDALSEAIEHNELVYYAQPFNLPFRYGVRRTDIHKNIPSIIMLRSMFIATFKKAFPEGILINIDAPLACIEQRLVARGDDAVTVTKRLGSYEVECAEGRELSDHNFDHSTMDTDEIAAQIISILYGK